MTESAAPPTSDDKILLAAEAYNSTCNKLNMYMLIFKRQNPQHLNSDRVDSESEEAANKQYN